jgi:predicted metal-dependent hydrolase
MTASHYTLDYGTTVIEYTLTYTDRKTLAIHVHPDGTVTVEAPQGSPVEQIEEKVRKRAKWIVKQQRSFQQVVTAPPRAYVSGETHRYLGRQYRLKVIQSATRKEIVKLLRGRLQVYTVAPQDSVRVKGLLEDWYRRQARRVYAERMQEWLPRFERYDIDTPEIAIRRMKSRWGSCTATGKITLNLKLIQLPKYLIDYVIVHELCHLVEHHHGPAFYRLLSRIMPDWEYRRDKLNTLL